MQLGILSDTHSRYDTVEEALQILQARQINTLLHCGDICDSETIWLFQGFTVHFVFGNCDWERTSLKQAIYGIGEKVYEPFGELELDGKRLAWLHGDDASLLYRLEQSGTYDYLFHGHTHQAKDEMVGATRVINPGALHRANPKMFSILELGTGELTRIEMA